MSYLYSLTRAVPLFFAATLPLQAAEALVHGNGVSVSATDLEADAQRIPKDARKSVLSRPDAVTQLASELFLRRSFASEAQALGLASDPVVLAAIQIARDRVLSDVALARLDEASKPSAAVLEAIAATNYKADPKRFEATERWGAKHILIKSGTTNARSKAERILVELKSGTSFEALARIHSDDAGSADKGGDLGFFTKGSMVPAFEEAVLAMKQAGDVSDVIETQFGLHIIKFEGYRAAGLRPFEEVRESITKEVVMKLQNEARAKEQKRIMKGALINQESVREFSRQGR